MTNILKFLLLCQLIILECNCKIKFEEQNISHELDECISRVTETLFEEDDSLFVLSSVNESFVLPNNVRNTRLLFSIDKKVYFTKTIYFKLGIVFHVDSIKDFNVQVVRFLFNSPLFYLSANPNVKWLIITSWQDFSKLFLDYWLNEIMNMVILVYNSNKNDTSLRLYTANPQAIPNRCGKALNMINEQNCKSKFTFEFPQALRKYTDCSITLEILKRQGHKKHVADIKAQFFANLIISRLNPSPTVRSEGNGFFINFDLMKNVEYYDSTSPLVYSGTAIWFVPKPRLISTVKVITAIFQKILWIFILFFFFITALVWWLIVKLKSKCIDSKHGFTLILLDMWGATLFGSVYKLPTIRALRFLVISYILYCIHIQALFTSKLLQSLTVPQYERAIKNVDDVSHSNLQVFASTQLKEAYYCNKNDSLYKEICRSLMSVAGLTYDDVCNCIKKYECVALYAGYEVYLSNSIFGFSQTFKDNSFTGSLHYTFNSLKWSYFTATIRKMTYMLLESGITNDFGKRSVVDELETAIDYRQV
ncbi:hypothetical protein FQR65_LT17410 [Abscondita terminalis]|nr:hypothetical protein FQR65_LT17410 [Abscondita terminalis]